MNYGKNVKKYFNFSVARHNKIILTRNLSYFQQALLGLWFGWGQPSLSLSVSTSSPEKYNNNHEDIS